MNDVIMPLFESPEDWKLETLLGFLIRRRKLQIGKNRAQSSNLRLSVIETITKFEGQSVNNVAFDYDFHIMRLLKI